MIPIISTLIISFLLLALPFSAKAAVFINEISPATDPEWVEIYNDGEAPLDLTGLLLEDGNSISTDDLVLSGEIQSRGYKVFEHEKGWLNDDGDTLKLYDPASPSAVLDQYVFGRVRASEVVVRMPDGGETWLVMSGATKGFSNPSLTPTPTPTPSPTFVATVAPTAIPTQTAAPTKTPTPMPTKSLTPKPTATPKQTPLLTEETAVLGLAATPVSETPSPTPFVQPQLKRKISFLPIVLITVGVGMMGFAVYNLIRARKDSFQN